MVYNDSRFEEIWNTVLVRLENDINDKTVFSTYFQDTKILSIEGDLVTILTNSAFGKEVLNRKFLEKIQDFLCDVTQSNFKCQIIDQTGLNGLKKNGHAASVSTPTGDAFITHLNPRYSFENFVVGLSNRECYSAALATAMNPGDFYNPLFIYGKSGLGKTHILHAIGNYVRLKRPAFKVLYLTADDFFEEYVRAIKDRELESLKDRFREIDLLLLDDVQFMATKERTKETFFHVFNLLVNAGKQIVITSDRPPHELRSLEDRLVGRFASGLSLEIKALEYETALAILNKKIEAQNINGGAIAHDVLEHIARHYASDVRQLEGALNKLLFYAITFNPEKPEIDMNTALETFQSLTRMKEKNPVTVDRIKLVVSEYYNISPAQLTSKLRTSNLVVARHLAMYLSRELLDLPLTKIGEAFGGRDHSTVINACDKVDKMLKENEDYVSVVSELKSLIKSQ